MTRDELRESFRRTLKPCVPDSILDDLVGELAADADQYAAHLIQEHAGPPPWRAAKRSSERKEATR